MESVGLSLRIIGRDSEHQNGCLVVHHPLPYGGALRERAVYFLQSYDVVEICKRHAKLIAVINEIEKPIIPAPVRTSVLFNPHCVEIGNRIFPVVFEVVITAKSGEIIPVFSQAYLCKVYGLDPDNEAVLALTVPDESLREDAEMILSCSLPLPNRVIVAKTANGCWIPVASKNDLSIPFVEDQITSPGSIGVITVSAL